MKKLMVIVLLFTGINIFSQKCDIKQSYKDLFIVEKYKIRDTIILSKALNPNYKKACFSNIITKYPLYLEYLLRHFSNRDYMPGLLNIKDSIAMQKQFIVYLKNDKKLDSVMTRLSNKLLQKPAYKDSIVTFNEMLDVAVKFFYFTKNKKTGQYAARICIGMNGIKETEPARKPFLEAFAYQSIMSNLDDGYYNMYDLYLNEMKKLHPLNFGVYDDEKVFRIQGAIYANMFQNKKLKELLVELYQKNRAILPFKIKDLPNLKN